MAVFVSAHAGDELVFAEKRLLYFAGELGALARVDHDLLLWFAPPRSALRKTSTNGAGSEGDRNRLGFV